MPIDNVIAIILCGVFAIIFFVNHGAKQRRIAVIDTFVFPSGIVTSLHKTYPHLSLDQIHLVLEQMREYFHLCNIAMGNRQRVGMPSKVVDEAWHEFILFTKEYESFCNKAFGTFLHHTPATAMVDERDGSESLRNAWRIACYRKNINPLMPSELPPIFAIDALLGISDGFAYSLDGDGSAFDAKKIGCNGGKGSSRGAASSYWFGSSTDESGCSNGCSGGCGGGD